ncbi:MAG: hypothetical protein GF417_03320 [Candidatus Latescibacteria bacterium]|nr:hypothetical protein [bacterium]MBD3423458.1 hypothetical protein [Candidatus Latescibacterota bacterium]
MNIFFWILQAVLALKFISAAITNEIFREESSGAIGAGFGRSGMIIIVALAFAGGAGMIISTAFGAPAWVTPIPSALLAIMTIAGIRLQAGCLDNPGNFAGVILVILNPAVCFGRLYLAPAWDLRRPGMIISGGE